MAPESRPRARRWRWLRRALVAILAFVALVVVFVFVVVHNLDSSWIKVRVQALVQSKAGVDIDYQAVHLRLLKGIEIDDFVLRSPLEFRGVAPELARVGRIEAGWSASLFTGSGRRVDRVALSDVALTVVLDENGRTSFDALTPPNPTPSPPKAKTPLSHQAGDLEALAPALPIVDVTGVSFTVVRTAQGHVSERIALRGLGLHADVDSSHLRANIGAASAPLDLEIARDRGGAPAGDAHARLWLTADLASSQLAATIDLEAPKQTFVQGLGATHLLHAEARARFDAASGKTDISLVHTFAADGIATAEAAIELPDGGLPVVHHAEGEVDFVHLLGIVPPDLVPVRARLRRGQIRYRVDGLALDALPRLNAGAKVAVDADFADVKVTQGGGDVDVGSAKLSAHVVPAADASIQVQASLSLDGGKLAAGWGGVAGKGLALDVEATQAKDGALTGNAALAFAALETTGAPRLAARGGKVGLRFEQLVVDPAAPLATHGDVTLTTDLASLDLRTAAMRTTLDGLALHAHTSLAGKTPYALEADARAAQLGLFDGAGRPLARVPVHIDAKVDGAVPDLENPVASRGVGHFVVDAGDVHARLDATKAAPDALDFSLDSNAPTLEAVRPFLPPDLAKKMPWEHMAIALRSHGHAERITSAAPSLEQHTEIDLERPAFERVAARALEVVVDSKGTALHPTLDGNVRFERLTLDGTNASDDHISFAATLDREAPALHLQIAADGRAHAKISTAFAFDRTHRAVTYDVEGNFAQMSSLAPLSSMVPGLKGVDLSKLEVALTARGALVGVVSDVDGNGALHLEPMPRRTAGIDGTVDLHAKQIAWSGGDVAVTAPALALAAKLHTEGARRTIDSHLEIDQLHVASGPRDFVVAGLSDQLSASVEGDLAEPNLELTHQMALRAVKQDIAPMYPVGDVTYAIAARRGRDGVIHVPKFELANGTGGTKITLRGAFDPSENQRRLALRGTVHQDLARMSTAPAILAAHGTADVAFRIESPNLSLFRTTADVKFEGANVRLPRFGVSVEGADGEVPITVAVRVGEHGLRLLREDQDNPYSLLR
ncbi:MAG TPA: hypothetical protein VNO21_02455, partial [Polyangiaceae bacterium]|nr:hypothetical protein [Polyangiaceae bacterium]